MSYQTYTTDAIVLQASNRETDNRSFCLFTRELGVLYAAARSVRQERSRQRYALQEFSLLRVSLVKGKSGWRIGSIEPKKSYYNAAVDKAARGSVVSLFRLLRRFFRGEEAQGVLFDYIIEALEVVVLSVEERHFVQTALAVRILGELGYVDERKLPSELVSIKPSEIPSVYQKEAEKIINGLYTQAVQVSHL